MEEVCYTPWDVTVPSTKECPLPVMNIPLDRTSQFAYQTDSANTNFTSQVSGTEHFTENALILVNSDVTLEITEISDIHVGGMTVVFS